MSLGSPQIDTTRREGQALQAVLSFYDTLGDQGEDEPAADENEAHDPNWPSPRERIVWERITGASLGQIANGLNRDAIAAPGRSDSWLPSAVWGELETYRPAGRF